jgi:hypothetical protein
MINRGRAQAGPYLDCQVERMGLQDGWQSITLVPISYENSIYTFLACAKVEDSIV